MKKWARSMENAIHRKRIPLASRFVDRPIRLLVLRRDLPHAAFVLDFCREIYFRRKAVTLLRAKLEGCTFAGDYRAISLSY